jgi:hypothetical protein
MKRGLILAAAIAAGLALVPGSSRATNTLPTLTVGLTRNAVTVGGTMTSGAVDVTTSVTGEAADDAVLVQLRPGVTVRQFGAVAKTLGHAPLDAIDPYGTIVFDSPLVARGHPVTAQAVLAPGTYVALNNGNGHAVFTVRTAAKPAALPRPGATVTAIDFAFRGAATLRDGELVRFVNDGYLIHMFIGARVRNVATARRAERLLLAGRAAQAKELALSHVQWAGPLSHGAMQQEVIEQPPGVYVILCAMNAQDGRDHYQLGMFRTIRIVR